METTSRDKTTTEPPAVDRPRDAPSSRPPGEVRSDAITLLAALQREARLVDIVKEPLAGYSDAQIGAAARDVLRDCGTVLERMFGLEPIVDQPEGTQLEAPADMDPGRYRLTGQVPGQPPFRGKLIHPGWQASRCDLPRWSGSPQAARVVAPAELEIGAAAPAG